MIINLSYKKKIIQSKDVHYPDNIDAFAEGALTWMIKAFKTNFNIDISKYSLNKLKQSKNSSGTSSITIEIEDEDIKEWRDRRLTNLLKND
jgi:hypothetical protein